MSICISNKIFLQSFYITLNIESGCTVEWLPILTHLSFLELFHNFVHDIKINPTFLYIPPKASYFIKQSMLGSGKGTSTGKRLW